MGNPSPIQKILIFPKMFHFSNTDFAKDSLVFYWSILLKAYTDYKGDKAILSYFDKDSARISDF